MKIILVDFSQVMISNLAVTMRLTGDDSTEVNDDLLRHFVLNSLRSYRTKFFNKYGEIVIACDDMNYWRKQIFPYYKARREKARKESKLDWGKIFVSLNTIKSEIKENFPYRVVQVPTAEADDVISVLAKRFCRDEKVLIISGDKDFKQLQSYPNVEQYDPVMSKMVVEKDPTRFLKELIMRGDKDDGVPNFLSQDDCLVIGKRLTSIMSKKLDVWVTQEPIEFCDDLMLTRYKRNKELVDLNMIPIHIQERIHEEYSSQEGKDRSKVMKYFIEHRLRNLAEDITSF